MIVFTYENNLSVILGISGITIDMICNSAEIRLVVILLYKIRKLIEKEEKKKHETAYKKYIEWMNKNI